MQKWANRLVGGLVLCGMVLGVVRWFMPNEVVPVLQQEALRVKKITDAKNAATHRGHQPSTASQNGPTENAPILELTSLSDFPLAAQAQDNAQMAQPQPVASTSASAAAKVVETQVKGAKEQIWLQVGAFGNAENARRRVEQLKAKKWQVSTEKFKKGQAELERVLIGPLVREEVDNYMQALQKMGIEGVREVSNMAQQ